MKYFHRIKDWWIKIVSPKPVNKVGDFSKFTMPSIKNMPSQLVLQDIMAVQPMTHSHKEFFIELYDLSNPRVGQVFPIKDKNPTSSCGRSLWHKIWTPNGWIFEETNPNEFKTAVETYVKSYKAEVEKERDQ